MAVNLAAAVGEWASVATPAVSCCTIMDGRFSTHRGEPASHHMHYESFAKHFLEVFDELVVVGRVFSGENPAAKPVVGPGVSFVALPAYRGPAGFARALPRLIATLWCLPRPGRVFILRVPGTIPSLFALIAGIRGVPFALQCVADPRDQLGAGSVRHPLRKLFRWLFTAALRWQCRRAFATSFVTKAALQEAFPPQAGRPTFCYTDLVLEKAAYREPSPTDQRSEQRRTERIIHVGMMSQLYKGQDTLIAAVAECVARGVDVHLTLVGDGYYRRHFAEMASTLGLMDRIQFAGTVQQGPDLWQFLDRSTLFVLPSRQEGLPRALLEAMARGLPCIATKVGGNTELVGDIAIVPADDPSALADRICQFLARRDVMHDEAIRNYRRALDFSFSAMSLMRYQFYQRVRLAAQ
jgi:glycosyltransferase involved in cell wall biosynthesis